MIEGLGRVEAHGMLSETLGYDLAVGRLAQGIAVDPGLLRTKLLSMLRNPLRLKQMGQNGRKRVIQLYSWEIVIGQWRELLAELEIRRHAAKEAGVTNGPAEPPWLPTCSTAFGAYASSKLSSSEQLHWSSDDAASTADVLLGQTLDSWDTDLVNQFTNCESLPPEHMTPRLKGWLLKQGLIKTSKD